MHRRDGLDRRGTGSGFRIRWLKQRGDRGQDATERHRREHSDGPYDKVELAVNNLPGLTKLFTRRPPVAKSTVLLANASGSP